MEDNLRKHILSQYINNSGMKQIFNPTVNTAAGEISDPDEFLMQSEGPTVLTENVEMSDPSSICWDRRYLPNQLKLQIQMDL